MDSARGKGWSEDENRIFIDIWGSESVQARLDGTSRNAIAFRAIQEKMKEMGFDRTLKEIKNKIKNLKRDYKKVIDHNKRSGVEPRDMPYKDVLDNILGDRPAMVPKHTFESSIDCESDMSFEMDSQDGLDEDTDDQSTQSESEASEVSPTPSLCSPTSSQLPDGNKQVDTSATAGPIKRKKVMSSLPSSGSKKSRQDIKKTRMKNAVNMVAEAFCEQNERSEKSQNEREEKRWKEFLDAEREWRAEVSSFNTSVLDCMKSVVEVMRSSNRPATPTRYPFQDSTQGGPSTPASHYQWPGVGQLPPFGVLPSHHHNASMPSSSRYMTYPNSDATTRTSSSRANYHESSTFTQL